MKLDEFLEKLRQLDAKYEDDKIAIIRDAALSNNPYEVGSVFKDHQGRIKVEKIQIASYYNGELPMCKYFGTELKKDGTPTKRESKRWAYQCNEQKD